MKNNRATLRTTALVIHPDITALAAFQGAFSQHGVQTIAARDLPTALLAITQHYFDVAIVSSRISEEGDGWPLAGVLHMAFPRSHISVMAPKTGVLELKSAINHGISSIHELSTPAEEVVAAARVAAPTSDTSAAHIH